MSSRSVAASVRFSLTLTGAVGPPRQTCRRLRRQSTQEVPSGYLRSVKAQKAGAASEKGEDSPGSCGTIRKSDVAFVDKIRSASVLNKMFRGMQA